MDIKAYFENNQGTGVLSTADEAGKVNGAIYARPHVMDDGTLAFIMRDRLSHHNLQSNPHAAYLFIEDGPGYKGKRLYLKKLREEQDTDLLESLKRRKYAKESTEAKFLVFFELTNELPLIGEKE
jgi:hypothetical protein